VHPSELVEGLVHAETQVGEEHVDLTAAEVARVDEPGAVDFGGGELAAAAFEPVGVERRDPDDDYGWWNLAPGGHVVRFNESLTGAAPVVLEPRPALVARGAHVPTVTLDSLGPVPLAVPEATAGVGLRLKENARVARVRAAD
jgi:hypothetical protein